MMSLAFELFDAFFHSLSADYAFWVGFLDNSRDLLYFIKMDGLE
jgi:hypothetical protein